MKHASPSRGEYQPRLSVKTDQRYLLVLQLHCKYYCYAPNHVSMPFQAVANTNHGYRVATAFMLLTSACMHAWSILLS